MSDTKSSIYFQVSIDRLAADVAAIRAKVDAISPEAVQHFVESEKAWVKLVEEQRDAAICERDQARALWKLAQVQRTAAYADRDEARAEVRRLNAELAARPPANSPGISDSSTAAPQPAGQGISPKVADTQSAGNAAPAAGWLTEEERELLQSRLHALRVYLRSLCKPAPGSVTREVEIIDALLARAGSPPVVEVPELGFLGPMTGRERGIVLAYRDALDAAGVKWKEVGRE